MSTYISLLRGINLGPHKKINMKELKDQYEYLGLKNVKTYINSGNVIFDYSHTNFSILAGKIQKRIKEKWDFDVEVLVRSKAEFEKLVKNNPFVGKDEKYVYVTFLDDKPKEIPVEDLVNSKSKSEDFLISGREIYLFCPTGYGTTKLSNNFFERKLKVNATTRNWNSVKTLLSMA